MSKKNPVGFIRRKRTIPFENPATISQFLIIKFAENNEILLVGYENGGYTVHHRFNFEKYVRMYVHDKDYGRVRNLGLSYQGNLLMSAATDGTLLVHDIDR